MNWYSLKSNKGFTLIELLVVIAIIGLLSTIVVATLSSVRSKARDTKRIADVNQIMKAMELYYYDHNAYPNAGGATNGPNNGWSNSSDASWQTLATSMKAYISSLPIDPVNQAGDPLAGSYTYAYASNCGGYMLVYRLENPSMQTSPGVKYCGSYTNYANTITIGVGY